MGNTQAFGQKCCPLPSLLTIGIILAQFWHQFSLKVLPIANTYCTTACHIFAHILTFLQEPILTRVSTEKKVPPRHRHLYIGDCSIAYYRKPKVVRVSFFFA
jgi:hypothetical protein